MFSWWRRRKQQKQQQQQQQQPGNQPPRPPADIAQHASVIQASAAMARDPEAQALAGRHGLQVLSLTWEDTGRNKGSAVGPNISDMTIQVQTAGTRQLTCMPVIRPPNFADKTGDLALDEFYLLVGNERGGPLKRIGLREYLGNLRRYLTRPGSWKGAHTSLLAERDTHVLVSAQACFLPVPKQGVAEFNPVLFNYQSSHKNPAVLTILVTREGTSATVIDNVRDGFNEGVARGQRLFFNKNGQRAALTGQRISDFVAEQSPDRPAEEALAEARAKGLNTVLLIQVPLKYRAWSPTTTGAVMFAMPPPCAAPGGVSRGASDVEEAVIGHGEAEGPYTEIDDLEIERDERFPIRVTVQFYKATSNGVLSAEDARAIAGQIDRVYAEASYVGSLVVEGDTGRPTEPVLPGSPPAGPRRGPGD
jgi:hypothetical protein